MESVGRPVVVTVKVPGVCSVKVVLLADVNPGAASTVRVNDWVAGLPTELLAVIVMGETPLLPTAGVPARVAVPLPLLVRLTPLGKLPDSVMLAGVGRP